VKLQIPIAMMINQTFLPSFLGMGSLLIAKVYTLITIIPTPIDVQAKVKGEISASTILERTVPKDMVKRIPTV